MWFTLWFISVIRSPPSKSFKKKVKKETVSLVAGANCW
jgi:hypothetical protein